MKPVDTIPVGEVILRDIGSSWSSLRMEANHRWLRQHRARSLHAIRSLINSPPAGRHRERQYMDPPQGTSVATNTLSRDTHLVTSLRQYNRKTP